jgi:hypothetical protein
MPLIKVSYAWCRLASHRVTLVVPPECKNFTKTNPGASLELWFAFSEGNILHVAYFAISEGDLRARFVMMNMFSDEMAVVPPGITLSETTFSNQTCE